MEHFACCETEYSAPDAARVISPYSSAFISDIFRENFSTISGFLYPRLKTWACCAEDLEHQIGLFRARTMRNDRRLSFCTEVGDRGSKPAMREGEPAMKGRGCGSFFSEDFVN